MKNSKIIKQTLTCELTDKERQDYGISLATTLADYESLETEKKQNADHFKDRLAGLQARADELARKVRDGKEWREVECRVHYSLPDREHKQTIRLDTMEVVKTERMTETDLQLVMPLEEDFEDQDITDDDDFDGVTIDAEPGTGLPAPEVDEDEDEDDLEDPEYDPADFGNLDEDTLKKSMVELLRFKSSKTRIEWLRKYMDRVFEDVPAHFVRYCIERGPQLQITKAVRTDLETALSKFSKNSEPMPEDNAGIESETEADTEY